MTKIVPYLGGGVKGDVAMLGGEIKAGQSPLEGDGSYWGSTFAAVNLATVEPSGRQALQEWKRKKIEAERNAGDDEGKGHVACSQTPLFVLANDHSR